MAKSWRDALRVQPGAPGDLDALDARATPLASGKKAKTAPPPTDVQVRPDLQLAGD